MTVVKHSPARVWASALVWFYGQKQFRPREIARIWVNIDSQVPENTIEYVRADLAGDLATALREAMECIHIFHGPTAWEIYRDTSPEMQRFRAALTAYDAGGKEDEMTYDQKCYEMAEHFLPIDATDALKQRLARYIPLLIEEWLADEGIEP